jgi:hypothetical protein
MSAYHHFVKNLPSPLQTSHRSIAEQRRRIARVRCRGGNTGDAEEVLETMLDVQAHHQDVHNQLLFAVLTTTARPVMAH